MSFEKRLYDYEVNPPQQAWEKLSSALDDLQLENSFKKKLHQLKTGPPINMWEKIERHLDGKSADTVPGKLYELSETPPREIWDRIWEQLADDEFNKKIAARLGSIEVLPPVGNWRKIASNIDHETQVVPFTKRYSQPLRYAAAAVVIGLIAWAGFTFFDNPNNSSVAEITKEKPLNNSTQNQSNDLKPADQAVAAESIQTPDLPVKTQAKAITHKTEPNNFIAASNVALDTHSGSEDIIADASLSESNKKAEINNTVNSDDSPRYLVYLNDKGSLMKVSKKLADLTCIYTKEGEVSQNALAKLDRMLCNDVVLCWQEKLALAPTNLSFNPLEMADVLNKQ